MSEKVSILNQYTRRSGGDLPVQKATAPAKTLNGKQPYRAYGIETARYSETMLRVEHEHGLVELIDRSMIRRVLVMNNQYVAIFLDDNQVMTLEGKNLAQVVDLLQDKQIRSLTCFSPDRHPEPEEAADPIITGIFQQTTEEFMQSATG